jgi:hypothetical protein
MRGVAIRDADWHNAFISECFESGVGEQMNYCLKCDANSPGSETACAKCGLLLIKLPELEPGTKVGTKYVIERRLSVGGMGIVYLAQHILLKKPRALKFISGGLSQDTVSLQRFLREAQAAVNHPNVVQVYDLERFEDGSPYIAMEYVEGLELRYALGDGAKPFAVERALGIARGVARGLGAAHVAGIYHRDVKPENIMLAGGGDGSETPKLLDFGIAAVRGSSRLTPTDKVIGTPFYAAPEQWGGGEIDGRTDLYALGGVLFEMLTGRKAFHAESEEGWGFQHLKADPPRPSSLRSELARWEGLDKLVLKLLDKDREMRPKDSAEVVRLLDEVEASHSELEKQEMETAAKAERLRQDKEKQEDKARRKKESQRAIIVWGSCIASILIAAALLLAFGWPYLRQNHSTVNPKAEKSPLGSGSSAPIGPSAGPQTNPEVQAQLGAQTQPAEPNSGQDTSSMLHDSKPSELKVATATAMLGNTSTPSSPALDAPGKLVPPLLDNKRSVQEQGGKTSGEAPRTKSLIPVAPRSSTAPAPVRAVPNPEAQAEQKPTRDKPSEPSVQKLDIAQIEKQAAALYGQKRYSEASVQFDVACSGGNGDACDYLGDMYQQPVGVPRDYARAATSYSKACDAGISRSCYNRGVMQENGWGVEEDIGRAATFYSKACDSGSAEGCSTLASLYNHGRGVERNLDKAATLYSRAVTLYSKACDAGDAEGCTNLGRSFENGIGVPQNQPQAARSYSKACDLGSADACIRLGVEVEQGKDKTEAAIFYSKACDAGTAVGCNHLNDLGLAIEGHCFFGCDHALAAKFYAKACNDATVAGCDNLGLDYEDGTGVGKDKDRALKLYIKACNGGDVWGCYHLGLRYQKGDGIEKNEQAAWENFDRACSQGIREGCNRLKK